MLATFFQVWYWAHWTLDVLLFVAAVSVVFRPYLIARLYLTFFLSQQIILNGCLMTKIQNAVAASHGYTTSPNRFIMAEVIHNGAVIAAYKLLFLVIIVWQLYYIIKGVHKWTIFQPSRRVTSL